MKQHKPNRHMDEREKLRKFRELDDAFAEALRELEKPNSRLDIPTGPPVRSLADQEADDEQARQHLFEERLKTLMSEYAQPRDSVALLLRTMQSLGHIA
ncbi:hypothetical protein [Halomonas chromatireducens]|uniref:Uncharacterized protein n=1 Tax=Halomonas chromatireducens TaxID=507626 RepID=A0A109ULF0_9GAMM|nr:hypothetical protein [Halomonas chromatireducens]AMD00458.1 hypothetical protein LOKO_01390 [Halomonas chromatireducens]